MESAKNLIQEYKYDFKDHEIASVKFEKGLNENVVRRISQIKNESEWILNFRLNALRVFFGKIHA